MRRKIIYRYYDKDRRMYTIQRHCIIEDKKISNIIKFENNFNNVLKINNLEIDRLELFELNISPFGYGTNPFLEKLSKTSRIKTLAFMSKEEIMGRYIEFEGFDIETIEFNNIKVLTFVTFYKTDIDNLKIDEDMTLHPHSLRTCNIKNLMYFTNCTFDVALDNCKIQNLYLNDIDVFFKHQNVVKIKNTINNLFLSVDNLADDKIDKVIEISNRVKQIVINANSDFLNYKHKRNLRILKTNCKCNVLIDKELTTKTFGEIEIDNNYEEEIDEVEELLYEIEYYSSFNKNLSTKIKHEVSEKISRYEYKIDSNKPQLLDDKKIVMSLSNLNDIEKLLIVDLTLIRDKVKRIHDKFLVYINAIKEIEIITSIINEKNGKIDEKDNNLICHIKLIISTIEVDYVEDKNKYYNKLLDLFNKLKNEINNDIDNMLKNDKNEFKNNINFHGIIASRLKPLLDELVKEINTNYNNSMIIQSIVEIIDNNYKEAYVNSLKCHFIIINELVSEIKQHLNNLDKDERKHFEEKLYGILEYKKDEEDSDKKLFDMIKKLTNLNIEISNYISAITMYSNIKRKLRKYSITSVKDNLV